jgi:hypothetical protein
MLHDAMRAYIECGEVKTSKFSGETDLVLLGVFCSIIGILCCGLWALSFMESSGRCMEVVPCRSVSRCHFVVRFPSCFASSVGVATSGRPSARLPNVRTRA